jgi:hypothetical protein
MVRRAHEATVFVVPKSSPRDAGRPIAPSAPS